MASSLTNAVTISDKRLAMAEAGLLPEPERDSPPAPRSGLANPAPLGLLCFGMTTGAACWLRWGLRRALSEPAQAAAGLRAMQSRTRPPGTAAAPASLARQ